MRPRRHQPLRGGRALRRDFRIRQRLQLLERQAGFVARQAEPHRPHAGAATFLDAGRRVVDLHAGAHIAKAQREHIGQRHERARAAARGEVVAGDDMVRPDASGLRLRQQHVHHLTRIPRAGADPQPRAAQRGEHLHRPRDGRRIPADMRDLHRHEALVDRVDVAGGRRASEAGLPLRLQPRVLQQRADVVALGQPHRSPRFVQRQRDPEGRERVDEDLRRRQRAVIDQRAGPVEDHRLQVRIARAGRGRGGGRSRGSGRNGVHG